MWRTTYLLHGGDRLGHGARRATGHPLGQPGALDVGSSAVSAQLRGHAGSGDDESALARTVGLALARRHPRPPDPLPHAPEPGRSQFSGWKGPVGAVAAPPALLLTVQLTGSKRW